MTIEEFVIFVREHCVRHREWKHDDPFSPEGRVYFKPWLTEFQRLGVDYETATVASERLVNQPPRFARDHWKALRQYALEALRSRPKSHYVEEFDPDNPPVPAHEFRERFWAAVAELRAKLSPPLDAPAQLGRRRWYKPPAEAVDGDLILWREYGEPEPSERS